MNGINVVTQNGTVELTSKNFQAQLDFVKNIKGRKWNPLAKCWEVPMSKADFLALAINGGYYSQQLVDEAASLAARQQETFDEVEAVEAVEAAIAKRYGKDVSIETPKMREDVLNRIFSDGETAEEIADQVAEGMGWQKIPERKIDVAAISKMIGKKS